jgi:hypothetical protein
MQRSTLALVLAATACHGHTAPPPALVVAAPTPPGTTAPPWPKYQTRCPDPATQAACLLAYYTGTYAAFQGGEAATMVGESVTAALADHVADQLMQEAATPPGGGPATVERCSKLSRAPTTVTGERIRLPQRDCYWSCLHDATTAADQQACVARNGCARVPEYDGTFDEIELTPAAACIAAIDPAPRAPSACDGLDATEPAAPFARACEPRAACEQRGGSVRLGDCDAEPEHWWCEAVELNHPKANCVLNHL